MSIDLLFGVLLGTLGTMAFLGVIYFWSRSPLRLWHSALRCRACDRPLAERCLKNSEAYEAPFEKRNSGSVYNLLGCPHCGNLTYQFRPDGDCPAGMAPLQEGVGRYTWYGKWEWK